MFLDLEIPTAHQRHWLDRHLLGAQEHGPLILHRSPDRITREVLALLLSLTGPSVLRWH